MSILQSLFDVQIVANFKKKKKEKTFVDSENKMWPLKEAVWKFTFEKQISSLISAYVCSRMPNLKSHDLLR